MGRGFLFLLLMISTTLQAQVLDFAKMVVVSNGFTIYESDTPLTPIDTPHDPLLCQRVAHHIKNQKKIALQTQNLLERMARDPNGVTANDLRELDNLKLQAQESFAFLAQPAPVMIAKWNVRDLTDKIIDQLSDQVIPFTLDSYALIWESNEDYFMPRGTASLITSKASLSVSLVLESKVASFCARKPSTLTFYLENKGNR